MMISANKGSSIAVNGNDSRNMIVGESTLEVVLTVSKKVNGRRNIPKHQHQKQTQK